VPGTLEIVSNDTLSILIEADSAEYVYNNTERTLGTDAYTVSTLPAGITVTAETSGAALTNVGTEANTVESFSVFFNGVDITANVLGNVTTEDGELEITPRPVTITAEDKIKMVGTSDPTLTADYDGFMDNDHVPTYALTRAPGEIVGEYAITFSTQGTNPNYSITWVPGTLEIVSNDTLAIVITARSLTETYRGTSWTLGTDDYEAAHRIQLSSTKYGSTVSTSLKVYQTT
jgi:hypothetical protein